MHSRTTSVTPMRSPPTYSLMSTAKGIADWSYLSPEYSIWHIVSILGFSREIELIWYIHMHAHIKRFITKTRRVDGVRSSLRQFATQTTQAKLPLIQPFLFHSCLEVIGQVLSALGRSICFTPSINSNVNCIQKQSHRHTLNNISPNV